MILPVLALAAFGVWPEWSVLYTEPQFAHPEGMFEAYLKKQLDAQNDTRRPVIEGVTPANLAAYRAATLAKLKANLGPFPERTPLRPRVTGKLARDGYSIEKVIFESRPHYYVTADVYLPSSGTAPFPGVLCPVGHWGSGKYFEDYQRLGVWFARHGFAAIVYDVPGQGERWQYYNAVLNRSLVDPGTSEYFVTIEHWLSAGPNILGADNFGSYIVWDGIRALDYLASRPDVDPKRLACTGVSGGGLQTELLAALDERIKVAIPVCYGGCAMETPTRPGLSPADVDLLIAPRPLLMIEATGDSRPTVLAKRDRHALIAQVYQRLGAGDKTRFFVAEGPHGYLASMREEATAWIRQWMNSGTEASTGRPAPLEPVSELKATSTGQVTTALGGETVFSLTRTDTARVRTHPEVPSTREAWTSWRASMVKTIARRIGYSPSTAPLNPKVVSISETPAYKLEKVVYFSDEGLYVPGLLFLPKTAGPHPAVIWVDEAGKSADPPLSLVARGQAVFSIDVAGFGETAPANPSPYNQRNYRGLTGETETDLFFAARSMNRSLVGYRARDIIRAVDYLATRPDIDHARIGAAGREMGGLLVLFAAALDSRIASVTAGRTLATYAGLAGADLYAHRFGAIIPGVLRDFDLPEVAAAIAPRRLTLVNPVDRLQRRIEAPAAYDFSRKVYKLAGGTFAISYRETEEPTM